MEKKYIDSEKLIAEIERRIKSVESCPFIEAEFGAEMKREGKVQAYNDILSLISSLQQEQPLTIEKVVEQCKKFGGNPKVIQPEEMNEDFFFDEVLKVYDDNDKYPPRSEEELTMLEIIARHFYKLGFNARK